MKQIIPPEFKSKTISNIIVVTAGMAMLALLLYFRELMDLVRLLLTVTTPFIIGFGLAFIQAPILHRVEWFLSKTIFRRREHPRAARAIGTTVSLLVILALLGAFLGILLPQIAESVNSLIQSISNFLSNNTETINELLVRLEFLNVENEQIQISWQKILTNASNYVKPILENVFAISSTLYTTIFQLFVGLITAFYLLLEKERLCAQMKKIGYALIRRDTCERLIYWTRRANHIFAGFLSGKIVDSIIIGVLCYVGMRIFRMEYAVLISVVVGVTNIIPFFGPFIGAIPSILILLIVNPISALWFGVFVLVLQQLDGNVIGPLILGDSVGVKPLWIMVSIVIGGELFGFVGMLLSVPVFALCYAIFKTIVEGRLAKKNLPIESEKYSDAPENL